MSHVGLALAKNIVLKRISGLHAKTALHRPTDYCSRSGADLRWYFSIIPTTWNSRISLKPRSLVSTAGVLCIDGQRCRLSANLHTSTRRHEEKKQETLIDAQKTVSLDNQVGDAKDAPVTSVPPPSTDEEEEKRKKEAFARKAMKWSLVAMGVSFVGAAGLAIMEWGEILNYLLLLYLIGSTFDGQPPRDENGQLIRDEFSDKAAWQQYVLRAWKEMVFYEKMIKEPSREKLLPDPLKEPYHQPPYTLVLEMTGVLVHPDWTYATGWRFKKRPGVEHFLEQLAGPFFEVVIYTNEQAFTAYPILLSLDPNNYIMYRLFRDSTRYVKGKHVKDLSYLNRDLSKVIVVDFDPDVLPGHERNAIFLPKWNGNDDDRTLFDLATLLKTIAASEVEDVREILDNYKNEDDILEAFRRRQELLREEQTRVLAAQSQLQNEQERRSLLSAVTPSIFGRR